MLGLMYIHMAKSYESLQSEHSLEYMPKTWTEVDEGEWRKECNAASPTASTMAPGPSSTSCNAALNDEEFDDENYKRLDPRSALGVVAERVSCRVCPPRASATQSCARRYVLGGDTFEVDGGERSQESSLQGAHIKRRRLGSKAGNCHDDDR